MTIGTLLTGPSKHTRARLARLSGVPFTEQDIYHFREGTYVRAYENLGAHAAADGTRFAVWAPNAAAVAVIGDFNHWGGSSHALHPRADASGIWEGTFANLGPGTLYKYRVTARDGSHADKCDPFAFRTEVPPRTASVVWQLDYAWNDADWMQRRARINALDAPWSIYELHVGSWRRVPEDGNRPLDFRELAHAVANYVTELGFTHVELLPVMEHPFYGSWGYQITGYFAPSARYGTPQDFMYFVDHLHARGIGVILDWVPSHFPTDAHGLARFDGTYLYEHEDPRQGFHPEWSSSIFNYGRAEVRNFLISNALFWLERYHVDALRVDAVASMLYLDYGRLTGQWIPNRFGGRENLEAVEFLKQLNLAAYRDFPDTQTIAEESTAWPLVSRPVHLGGLGFGLKWNMGWMHDTLRYFQQDPVHRKFHHNRITFSLWYAFTENFVLPLSHDEVVHGKGALIGKMPGDEWQQFANLRLLLGYMWAHPGKKLLFMGGEFGQRREWQHEESLEWHVLQYPLHQGVQRWIRDLNRLYRATPALHARDFDHAGFTWIDCEDADRSVVAFLRRDAAGATALVVCNFTPVPRPAYRIGVPQAGRWQERLNSDAADYGGSGLGNLGALQSQAVPAHGYDQSLEVGLPPLALLILTPG
ncbi:MAG: 1,4-alpha-glucan branching protein GlgB [Proteobacteria bacterium]|nr:1,4-alpha-glucan branching protein GlgB [Pseudomonadota bacterium]